MSATSFTLLVAEGCTACGICLATCPERALVAAAGRPATAAGRCTGCLACIEVCPRDVITVEPATSATARHGEGTPCSCGGPEAAA